MSALGSGSIIVGVLMALGGIGGFIDTRKIDRRFKTGYKNNEPDTRDFGRSGKVLLCGMGVCLAGVAINSVSGSEGDGSGALVAQVHDASTSERGQRVDRSASSPADNVVLPDPSGAQDAAKKTNAPAPNASAMNAVSEEYARSRQPQISVAPVPHAESERSAQAYSTSFDCARATHNDELAICGDAGLAAMDRHLNQLYDSSMTTISDPQALKKSEANWVIARQSCNQDVDCLRRMYGERIGQFMGSLGSKPLLATELPLEAP